MISVIVCSIDDFWFEKFSKSLKETIGIEYQLIKIDNKKEKLSITKAYNKGASEAIYDILIFVHEDVVFHSQNWGVFLHGYFDNLKNPGVLGVVGSSYLPISPSDWWISDQSFIFSNYISNSKEFAGIVGSPQIKGAQVPSKVYVLDGMFLAIKKEAFEGFRFDDGLEGFHGYDTDICLQVSRKFQNYFIPNIQIEHFSKGKANLVWLLNTEKAKRKILSKINRIKKEEGFSNKIELKAFHLFLGQLYKYGDNRFNCIKLGFYYFKQVAIRSFHWRLIPVFFWYLMIFSFKRTPYFSS
ncbi:glycosyltransferase [Algoriphagus zhangzhouensis]|nr:glycosyltransferase [Algoriphagus zhangzhouensis]